MQLCKNYFLYIYEVAKGFIICSQSLLPKNKKNVKKKNLKRGLVTYPFSCSFLVGFLVEAV